MDLNHEYATHQRLLLLADRSASNSDRDTYLAQADQLAGRIGSFQQTLGAAAACAWSATRMIAVV